MSRDLRLTAQAEADAWQQSADAQTEHDPARSADATAPARHLAARRGQLQAANARYQTWAAGTGSSREAAGQASAELQRRELAQQTAGQRHADPEDEPQTAAQRWRQIEADLAAVDRALEREQQAAIAAGQPWPPKHTAQAQTTPAEAAAVIARLQRDGTVRNRTRIPKPPPLNLRRRTQPQPCRSMRTAAGRPARPARPDALQARTDQAAHRIAAGNAAREAHEPYTARLNAKPAPKPSRRPNARPKPWTGSRWSHRPDPHRRGPVPGAQHAHGSDRGDGQVDAWHDFRSEFARASARRPASR